MQEPLEADLNKVRLLPLKRRKSKIQISLLGREPKPGESFCDFWQGLPDILAVKNFRLLADKIRQARREHKPVLVFFGAHVIKVGLSRYLIKLMEEGYVTALATNGASVIHDFEISFFGETSEDVAENLQKGTFGFAQETGKYLNDWVGQAAGRSQGLGRTIGQEIFRSSFPNKNLSLLAKAYELKVPATVHVGIGTDIVYQHPSCDGGAWGRSSYTDFKRLVSIVSDLSGGVVMNWGSAVLMPEVFLKALAINKNLGKSFKNLTCANFDMIPQYRARVNVLERPTQEKGSLALNFIGHHEILLPLLCQALIEGR